MTLLRQGLYKFIETKIQTKILYLDRNIYEITQDGDSGQIVTATHTIDKSDSILGIGSYRLTELGEGSPGACLRLELEQDSGAWQTYNLSADLPHGNSECTTFIANDKSAEIVQTINQPAATAQAGIF